MSRPAIALGLTLAFLAGCVGSAPSEPAPVVASFYPVAFLAQRIAGDDVAVHALVPAGTEPHEWDPTPAAVRAVADAKVVLYNGAGFEPWIERVVAQSGTRASVVDLSKDLDLREADDEDHHEEEAHDGETGFDPHYWLDPVLYARSARHVGDALARAFPEHADAMRERAKSLEVDLLILHGAYDTSLGNCAKRKILTTHSAFGYLAHRYNFTLHSVSGLSPDSEPSAGQLRDVVELAKRENINVVFFETLVSPRVAQAIARELPNGTTMVLDPIEGIPPAQAAAGKNYFTQARANLANLRIAMECA